MNLRFSIDSIKTDRPAVQIFEGDGTFWESTLAVPQDDWLEFRATLERYGCSVDETACVHEYVSGAATAKVTLSFTGFCMENRQADPSGTPWCTFKRLQNWDDRCMNLAIDLCRVASVTFTPFDDHIHPVWFGQPPADLPLDHQVHVLRSLGDVHDWLSKRASKT